MGGGKMTGLLQSPQKDHRHEMAIRNVVDFAHEVRIHLNDSQIIFGSVMPFAAAEIGTFRIRPWGLPSPMAIRFDDVCRAVPVKQMAWLRHRSIAAAQLAGNFARGMARPPH
jgi:hypothetical protein